MEAIAFARYPLNRRLNRRQSKSNFNSNFAVSLNSRPVSPSNCYVEYRAASKSIRSREFGRTRWKLKRSGESAAELLAEHVTAAHAYILGAESPEDAR